MPAHSILILVFFLIIGASSLMVFILFKIKEIQMYNHPPQKPVNKMTMAEVKKALIYTDLHSIRWIEDVIETLIGKGVLTTDELPLVLQKQLNYKAELRLRLKELTISEDKNHVN